MGCKVKPHDNFHKIRKHRVVVQRNERTFVALVGNIQHGKPARQVPKVDEQESKDFRKKPEVRTLKRRKV